MSEGKTCILCEHHVWSDHQFFHICIKTGKQKRVDAPSCPNWKQTKRGWIGCQEHSNIIDMDVIEGKVKDDKYTRRK